MIGRHCRSQINLLFWSICTMIKKLIKKWETEEITSNMIEANQMISNRIYIIYILYL